MKGPRRFTLMVALLMMATAQYASADSINVTIDTSAIAGSDIRLAFDLTANTANLNRVNILNFSAPGSVMDLPETSGGLVEGDLILVKNPAGFTTIGTDHGEFFNELIVNLDSVGSGITFQLNYSPKASGAGKPPDQFAFFLLDEEYKPLFPTADPLGTDALFSVDFVGANSPVSVYDPAALTSPGNILITVPGATAVPVSSTLSLFIIGLAGLFVSRKAHILSRR